MHRRSIEDGHYVGGARFPPFAVWQGLMNPVPQPQTIHPGTASLDRGILAAFRERECVGHLLENQCLSQDYLPKLRRPTGHQKFQHARIFPSNPRKAFIPRGSCIVEVPTNSMKAVGPFII